ERHHGALARPERLLGDALRGGVERGLHVVAGLGAAAELVDDRLELVLLALKLRVERALESGAAVRDELVADGVREQRVLRIDAEVALGLAAPLPPVHSQSRAVAREDEPARDLLLLEQPAPVERVV